MIHYDDLMIRTKLRKSSHTCHYPKPIIIHLNKAMKIQPISEAWNLKLGTLNFEH